MIEYHLLIIINLLVPSYFSDIYPKTFPYLHYDGTKLQCAEKSCPKGFEPTPCNQASSGSQCHKCPKQTYSNVNTFRKRTSYDDNPLSWKIRKCKFRFVLDKLIVFDVKSQHFFIFVNRFRNICSDFQECICREGNETIDNLCGCIRKNYIYDKKKKRCIKLKNFLPTSQKGNNKLRNKIKY